MSYEMQRARVAGPVAYAVHGASKVLPLGPCLIERIDGQRADVIWGEDGECCAVLPIEELVSAAKRGTLVLLN